MKGTAVMKIVSHAAFLLCSISVFVLIVTSGCSYATDSQYRSISSYTVSPPQNGYIVQKRVTYFPGFTLTEYAPYQTYRPYKTYYFANSWRRPYRYHFPVKHYGKHPKWNGHKNIAVNKAIVIKR